MTNQNNKHLKKKIASELKLRKIAQNFRSSQDSRRCINWKNCKQRRMTWGGEKKKTNKDAKTSRGISKLMAYSRGIFSC